MLLPAHAACSTPPACLHTQPATAAAPAAAVAAVLCLLLLNSNAPPTLAPKSLHPIPTRPFLSFRHISPRPSFICALWPLSSTLNHYHPIK
ncbi:hypothetical protein BDZ91DRAFT_731301 [Kalaharituber pfeilii]|nr:hypothetical protein BDZ91DRAFT_731301 [Kalaharituber pfeilii]